jgi:hypothetical protein
MSNKLTYKQQLDQDRILEGIRHARSGLNAFERMATDEPRFSEGTIAPTGHEELCARLDAPGYRDVESYNATVSADMRRTDWMYGI